MTYLSDTSRLPASGKLLIYGSGGRGKRLLADVRALGSGLDPIGFLDSFKSGRCEALKIHPVDELPELQRVHGEEQIVIVVASTFHRAIERELRTRGVDAFHVFLEPAETIAYLDAPEENIVRLLGIIAHPLNAPPQATRVRQGTCWRCESLSGLYMRPTGFSLCCWMPDLVRADAPLRALERLGRIRKLLVEAIDRGECGFCASCPELAPEHGVNSPDAITLLHMDTSTACNLACSYCNVKDIHAGCDYDPVEVYDLLRDQGLLAPGYRFDWGGFGEPTINPHFAHITGKMLAEGASGLVYTNALVRSPSIEQGLREGRLRIVCSIDAGTRETYRQVRNVDGFEAVWKNVETYAALNPQQVHLKYIVTTQNAGAEETDAFVDRCVRAGIRNVTISKDFFEKRTPDAVREGVRRLALECARRGLTYSFLGTAISPAFIRSLKLNHPAPGRKA
ncbi:radical SAM protein [Fundidesulfovibrio terrae]|uniref:radical SAM protein n=1 Tax=Fundidesulfovibrio terrae TaxID=2922866 RepID=UPI001FAECAD6